MREVMRELANSELAVLESSKSRREKREAEGIFNATRGKEQRRQSESVPEKEKGSLSNQVQQLGEVKQELETQLRRRDELLRKKDFALRGLEKALTVRIRDLENRVTGILSELNVKMSAQPLIKQ